VITAAAVVFAVAASAGAAPFGQIKEFSSGFSPGALVSSVTPGPDGNLWFADNGTTAIGQITTAGVVSEYSSGFPAGSAPGAGSGGGISYGPDGNIWFSDSGTRAIGAFDPVTHAVTEYKSGLNAGSSPYSVVAGSDGNIWFTDRGTTKAIGVINPATHAISEYSSGLNPGSLPNIPTFGPDGNTWFSDTGTVKAIGRIDVVTHAIAEFSSGISSTGPSRPIAGPDGNLWFVDKSVTAPAVDRITPSGVITEFQVTGLSPGQFLNSANFGPDGVLWIGSASPGAIFRFDITTDTFTALPNGGISGRSGVMVAGPDLNMWSTDSGLGGVAPAMARIGTGVCDDSLAGCNLKGVNLANIVLVGASLQGDNLLRAQLENARLIGASMQADNLNGAQLQDAFLDGANLEGANLHGADLSGADLSRADLTGANLRGATLTGAIWSNTTCPDGSNSDDDGGTCVNNL
jgi:virginiamycin B lyase